LSDSSSVSDISNTNLTLTSDSIFLFLSIGVLFVILLMTICCVVFLLVR
jgi:hypothetical protein